MHLIVSSLPFSKAVNHYYKFTTLAFKTSTNDSYQTNPKLLSHEADDYLAVVVEDGLPKFLEDFENPLELFGFKLKDKQLKSCGNSDLINSVIQEGHSVFTPLINIRFSIKGNFSGVDDNFDDNRHEKSVNITPGRSIKLKMKNLNK